MSDSAVNSGPAQGSGFKKLYQAPLPAIIALIIVFVWQGLGHTVMYLMEHKWFPDSVLLAAFIIGCIGAVMVWVGRDKSENAAKETLGEYRVMLSSIGVMFASLMYFFYNKDTRCNFFMWFHRNLRMKFAERSSVQGRNIAVLVAMEVIYITWFCYIWLLLLYNPNVFGTDHWFTLANAVFFGIWAIYLGQRLWWLQRMAPALRYAIPTAIIGWNVVEVLEKWGHLNEIWVQPQKYAFELSMFALALVAVIVLAIVSPARRVVAR